MNLRIFETSLDSILVLTSVNPDRQVNYGCNLKWKPADQKDTLLAIASNFREKTVSKALN